MRNLYFNQMRVKNAHNQQEITDLVPKRFAKLLISLINGIIKMFPVMLRSFHGLFLYINESNTNGLIIFPPSYFRQPRPKITREMIAWSTLMMQSHLQFTIRIIWSSIHLKFFCQDWLSSQISKEAYLGTMGGHWAYFLCEVSQV